MKKSKTILKAALLAGSVLAITASAASAEVLFWSTQAKPVEEAQAMRDKVLADAGMEVDYQPSDGGPWLTRLQAELTAGTGTIAVLGGLHGDFTSLSDDLVDLSDVDLGGVEVNATFKKLGMLGTDQPKYIPWMQAT